MKKWLVRLLILAACVYLGIIALFLANRHDLIYPFRAFPAQPVDLPGVKPVYLPATDAAPELEIWVKAPRGDKPVIVYFMGYAGNLALNITRLKEFVLNGYGLAAMTYRGGGGRPGNPTEQGLKSDARRMLAARRDLPGFDLPNDRLVFYGTSLGSGLATAMAAEVEGEAALILETPFTRLCDAAEAAYPLLPACLAMWDEHYASVDIIATIDAPLLILHGTADVTVPHRLGQALFDAAQEPKRFISYPGGRHNDLRLFGAGQDAIAFLEGL